MLSSLWFPICYGLVLFLFGMKVMEVALHRWAGPLLHKWLHKATSTPLKGMIASTAVTALLQQYRRHRAGNRFRQCRIVKPRRYPGRYSRHQHRHNGNHRAHQPPDRTSRHAAACPLANAMGRGRTRQRTRASELRQVKTI